MSTRRPELRRPQLRRAAAWAAAAAVVALTASAAALVAPTWALVAPPRAGAGAAPAARTAAAAAKGASALSPGAEPALELYSGIGGLRAALERAQRLRLDSGSSATSKQHFEVKHAYDVNLQAALAYKHYWGDAPQARSIEHVDAREFDKLGASLWLMSPPCQPYTKGGLQRDAQDQRAASLLYLIRLLDLPHEEEEAPMSEVAAPAGQYRLARPPRGLFLENVPGFEVSECRALLIAALLRRGYSIEEFLLSPEAVGYPNTRTRYYLVATLGVAPDGAPERGADAVAAALAREPTIVLPGGDASLSPPPRVSMAEILDRTSWDGDIALRVPRRHLELAAARGLWWNVIDEASSTSLTVTKGYGKHIDKAGPIMIAGAVVDADRRDGTPQAQERFRLVAPEECARFLAPAEIARLHGMPADWSFPKELSYRQCWALLGNSVHVETIARLMAVTLLPRLETLAETVEASEA